jgi:hypothetical protein
MPVRWRARLNMRSLSVFGEFGSRWYRKGLIRRWLLFLYPGIALIASAPKKRDTLGCQFFFYPGCVTIVIALSVIPYVQWGLLISGKTEL